MISIHTPTYSGPMPMRGLADLQNVIGTTLLCSGKDLGLREGEL